MTADIVSNEKLTELNTTIRESLEAVADYQRRAAEACKAPQALNDCYGAIEEIDSANRRAKAALERIMDHQEAYRLAHAPDQCAYMVRIDDQCRTSARPHMEFCEAHADQETDYQVTHEAADCCAQCCEGEAEHTVDGELFGQVKAA